MGSNIAQNDIIEKLLFDDQSLFKNFSRMSVEDFIYLPKITVGRVTQITRIQISFGFGFCAHREKQYANSFSSSLPLPCHS